MVMLSYLKALLRYRYIKLYIDKKKYFANDIFNKIILQRLNDSCIVYVNASTKPTKKNITCKSEGKNIGRSEILIGDKFAPVQDFKCRTIDLTNLSCTFQQASSYHPITYRLFYTISDGEVL